VINFQYNSQKGTALRGVSYFFYNGINDIEVNMQVSVEAPSKIERRMTVVVPVDKLDQAYDNRINKLAKTVKVAGFRPGKVPLDVIRQRYGDTVRQEALSEVIQSSLYAAIHQEKLNPVGIPMVEPKTVIAGQPLEFVATFEVLPPIENVQFNLTTLEKSIGTIGEADIERVVQHLSSQHTKWEKVDRASQEKDQVIIDFVGKIDGEKFQGGEAHDFAIVIGSKKMIPGFEEGLIGLSSGQEKTIAVTFPENYFAKEFAGKAAEFTVKMLRVMQPVVPATDEAFIRKLGVKSGKLEDLHAEIRRNLDREMERLVKMKLKNQVFDKLLEQNTVDIPKSLIDKESKRIHDELHPHHHGQEHQHSESEMAVFVDAAKRNVTLGLLVAELIKKYEIKSDKERIQTYISSISSAYEKPEDVQQWYRNNKQAMAEIEMQILEEQVVEKLLEGVTVTEKVMSYNELASTSQTMV
jgi:trigger factor